MQDGYFLKDTALADKKNDAFHHDDYVKNLKKLIEEHDPPFNIALIGKWGVGKSSIINLLRKELKEKAEYKVHEINAWKYENDSLKKAFLKNLWKNLNEEQDISIWKKYTNSFREAIMQVNLKDEPLTFKQTIKEIFPLITVLVILFLLSSIGFLGIFYLWDLINALCTDNTFGENAKDSFKSFKKNIWAPIIITPLFKMFQDFLKSSMQRKMADVRLVKPVETADEYEELFQEEIAKYKKNNPDFKKLVVIVDDLDRLAPKKVVAALDAIKAFVDVKECIFIVTCDENILIKALEKEKVNKSAEHIDGELFLDKLFHFRMPLPPIIESDMKQFAIDLAKQEAKGLVKSCNGQFEEIIDILIHADVTTPRQVKKLLNTFSNNLLIAKAREKESRKLEDKLLTGEVGLKFLAKLSVIQSDYNEVYLKVVNDFYFLTDLLYFYQQENPEDNNVNPSIKMLFNNKESKYKIKPEYEGLVNFLSRTQHITVENIGPFIYLGQDAIGLKAGDEKQLAIRKSLISGNEKGIISILEQEANTENIALLIIEEVKNAYEKDLQLVIKAALQLIGRVPDKQKRDLANVISYRLTTPIISKIYFWQIDPKNILDFYLESETKTSTQAVLLTVITQLFNKSNKWKNHLGREMSNSDFIKKISNLLDELLDISEKLPETISNKVKEFLSMNNESYRFYPFSEILQLYKKHEDLFDDYFDLSFYQQLIQYIEDDDEWEEALNTWYEIAPSIRDRHQKEFINSIDHFISMFDEEVAVNVIKLLEPVITDVDINTSSKIIKSIVSLGVEKESNVVEVMRFLQKLEYNIDSIEEFKEKIDKFVLKHLSNQTDETIKLIEHISSSDGLDFEIFKNVFNHIHENMLQDESYDDLLRRTNKYFTKSQREALFARLNIPVNPPSYNSEEFNRVYTLLAVLGENKENNSYIKSMIQNGIDVFRNNQWQQYYPWASAFPKLLSITAGKMEKTSLETFVHVVINSVSPSYPDLGVKSLMYIGKHIPEEEALKAINEVIIRANTDSSKLDAFEFLKSVRKYINKENENLNEYVEFLIDNLHLQVENFLDEINSKYSRLTKKHFIKLIENISTLNDEKIRHNTIVITRGMDKFYTSFETTEEKYDVLAEMLNKEIKTETIIDIVLKPIQKNVVAEILNQAITPQADDDLKNKEYQKELLRICGDYHQALDKKNLTSLIVDTIRESDDDYIKDICNILLDKYNDFRFRQEKQQISAQIIPTFRSVNMEAKEKIIDVAKVFHMEKEFEKAIGNKQLSSEEVELVSNKFNFRKKRIVNLSQ